MAQNNGVPKLVKVRAFHRVITLEECLEEVKRVGPQVDIQSVELDPRFTRVVDRAAAVRDSLLA